MPVMAMHFFFLSLLSLVEFTHVVCHGHEAPSQQLLLPLFVPPVQYLINNPSSRRAEASVGQPLSFRSYERPNELKTRSALGSTPNEGKTAPDDIQINNEVTENGGKSGSYIESPYLMDESGRPVGVKDNTILTNVQTPHSGRKFRPTHPSNSSSLKSRFGSRLRSMIRPWKRKGAQDYYSKFDMHHIE